MTTASLEKGWGIWGWRTCLGPEGVVTATSPFSPAAFLPTDFSFSAFFYISPLSPSDDTAFSLPLALFPTVQNAKSLCDFYAPHFTPIQVPRNPLPL